MKRTNSTKRINWVALAIVEAIVLLFSIGWTGRSRHDRLSGDEGNTIARLFLDDPTWLESVAFYFVGFHILMAVFFVAALVKTKRDRASSGNAS